MLFWVIWACLVTHTHTQTLKVILSNCRKRLYLSAEKNPASSNDCWSSSETVDSFIKWLLDFRYCTCFKQGVPWHSGNYRLKIHSKHVHDMIITCNQVHPPRFSGDVANICKLLILGTVGMSSYIHSKGYYQLQCLSACQKQLHHSLLFRDIKFSKILVKRAFKMK